ncbi:redox-regulated ATPase YchF [Candidatus Daviesbacteria bacterium RIFCSPLOWO2_01_FULL_43_38]|uniref:Ribosome-binding ATPase YchF n=2 Tax=Candidatus Daviesiibacteriota TaxID=1752718 RepID=A0A1F5K286_9BACT|nr:MAG: GTP-binding protein YchF [Candidatus Daviesbacteria bacterium GW2011_GWA2_42_7]OGE20557.1 MAG: redox-regulated ATPase YchF [Candidatus Daviesbacteria bacterium RIFCSPHIGHO2_01_FULL_43_17]OGE34964.1 MAG: redox-regulated ATPase YchF [Candidatus Daviesbacteria bacterium RIFCSPHIGHO2_12_FULL_43_11]OGE63364.1 MAG: redox-regulated ATPase YchF [Candidatus Daviesbacteria bacterium RIFCSPLOWO2_01_FULL_43_38]OGE71178.1 MAG: redox-regulated ATPase YchF [Candidatus Daviesbacteria bacterium RIFCSPLO
MSLRVGIVGLPNVGKSTLFNALLKKRVALSANYPFATIEPNVGVVAVPDDRLNELAKLVRDEEKMPGLPPLVPAVVEFVDIAGLVKGASTGAGLGNQFLSHIREVDAIVEVVRDFEDASVIREGSESPDADKLTIETELALSDLQVIEKIVPAQEKIVKAAKDPVEQLRLDILNQLKKNLEEGKVIGHYEIGDERVRDWFTHLPLLTIKPMLYVYNVSEEGYIQKVSDRKQNENEVVISAKLEEELADYSEEERVEYLKSLGIEKTGLERLIVKAYDLLGLISFLTAGKKEVRAWTLRRGETALRASGVIHTDFMKNFIRAQVISCDELLVHGSWTRAKEVGKVRTEGKDYEMKDGDVVEFLISG